MIKLKTIVSYAQYNEDLILLALLYDVDEGYYVDVGANHPVYDSVTKLFYKKGWHGINVEPIESLYNQLVEDRPKDINLHLGVGSKIGTETFREYTNIPGHSTFDDQQKKEHDSNAPYKDYEVKIETLLDIFQKHKVKHIHFLKVDVEGFEHEVINGNDWTKYRPEIICIEANHTTKIFRGRLLENNYKQFIYPF